MTPVCLTDDFDWAHAEVPDGVFVLTVYPQIMGRGHRLAKLADLVDRMASRPGVEFMTVSAVVESFHRGGIDARLE